MQSEAVYAVSDRDAVPFDTVNALRSFRRAFEPQLLCRSSNMYDAEPKQASSVQALMRYTGRFPGCVPATRIVFDPLTITSEGIYTAIYEVPGQDYEDFDMIMSELNDALVDQTGLI